MTFQDILFSVDNRVALVTVNRPTKLNALNKQVLTELGQAFAYIAASADIYAVVITGAGDKAFVAGADISELNSNTSQTGANFAKVGQDVFTSIEQCGKPVIAAVNGFALGGGCELALACHIRLASSNAKFGQPEINLGIIPGYGGTQRLPRIIGLGAALHWMTTGAVYSAEQALACGLVSSVVEAGTVTDQALELAQSLASKPPLAMKQLLQVTLPSTSTELSLGLISEHTAFGALCGSHDFREGTLAFLEKRAATFSGT
jgi:enoyl-CoA hydratase